MVRAAATGRIDYTQADSNDILWLTREKLVLEDLDRQISAEFGTSLNLYYAVSAIGPSFWDKNMQIYREQMGHSAEVLQRVDKLMRPWSAKADHWQSLMDHMREQYKSAFGRDPGSVETKQEVLDLNQQVERKKLETKRLAAERRRLYDKLRAWRSSRIRRGR
jgi:hypothetical protein